MPREPRSFQASAGILSEPGAFPFFIFFMASLTSASVFGGSGPWTGATLRIGVCGNSWLLAPAIEDGGRVAQDLLI